MSFARGLRGTVCRTWPELRRFTPPPAEFNEVHEALLQAARNSQAA